VQKNLIAIIFFHPHAIKLLNLKILTKKSKRQVAASEQKQAV
jgi:hypothetical protein